MYLVPRELFQCSPECFVSPISYQTVQNWGNDPCKRTQRVDRTTRTNSSTKCPGSLPLYQTHYSCSIDFEVFDEDSSLLSYAYYTEMYSEVCFFHSFSVACLGFVFFPLPFWKIIIVVVGCIGTSRTFDQLSMIKYINVTISNIFKTNEIDGKDARERS